MNEPSGADFLPFPILLGDIGGTNARLAVLERPSADPRRLPPQRTADHLNFDHAIAAALRDPSLPRPRSAFLAIAAPVDGTTITLTNHPWSIEAARLLRSLDLEALLVINDFEAQALAISDPASVPSVAIGSGEPRPGGNRLVIGPGTGLGVAALVSSEGRWVPLAGEGGHVDLSPRTAREFALWPRLADDSGRVSAERILSGGGLLTLYRAICVSDGLPSRCAAPEEVTQAAQRTDDEAASEAVTLFALCLARLAGDLALLFLARGGVFIGGGIFPRLMPLLDQHAIRTAFENKAPHRTLMAQIPLRVVTEPFAALSGLAACASAPGAFHLDRRGRHFTR